MFRSEMLILIVIIAAGAAAIGLGALFLPDLTRGFVAFFEPGLGLKTASIISVVIAFAALIVMAVVAGDGLIGELQYMIAGFFAFFVFFTLFIAWVF